MSKKDVLKLLAMATAFGGLETPVRERKIAVNVKKNPPIPKGCKVYYFDEVGNCLYDVEHETSVFSCIAINDKSAMRKFSKWLSVEMSKVV